MATQHQVIKNNASGAVLYTALEPRTATGDFLVNPTLAVGDVKISKDGAAYANITTLPNVQLTRLVRIFLSQAETNADVIIIMFVDAAGAEWADQQIIIQTSLANFDTLTGQLPTSLVGGRIDASVGAMAANVLTATAIATGALTAAKFASGAFDAVWTVAARTVTSLSGVVADIRAAVGLASANLDTQFTTVTSATTGINTKLGTPAGASVSVDIAAVKTDTAAISTRIPAALVSGRIDASVGAMAANVVTATAIASGAITSAKFAANALDAVWSTAARTLTSLTGVAADIRSALGLASANLDTQIAAISTKLGTPINGSIALDIAAVDAGGGDGGNGSGFTAIPWNTAWDTNVQENVRTGAGLATANLDTQIAAVQTKLGSPVGASVSVDIASNKTILTSITGRIPAALVGGRIDAVVGAVTAGAITSAGFASGALDAVWSTATRVLTSLSGVAADIRSAVGLAGANLDTQLSSHTSAIASVNSKLGTPAGLTVSADIAAVKADTANIGGTGAGFTAIPWNAAWDAHIASQALVAVQAYDGPTMAELLANSLPSASYATASALSSVKTDTGTTLPAAIAGISVLSSADVKAAMVEALDSDAYSEPGQGVPAVDATLADKIGFLYKAWRNRSSQSATTYTLYADDASTVHQKATTSDDGTTFTRGEVASGP